METRSVPTATIIPPIELGSPLVTQRFDRPERFGRETSTSSVESLTVERLTAEGSSALRTED
jgi:hypothetical protein